MLRGMQGTALFHHSHESPSQLVDLVSLVEKWSPPVAATLVSGWGLAAPDLNSAPGGLGFVGFWHLSQKF
jgi:hypothetical protein